MAEGTDSPSAATVRELIFAYERHSNSSTKPLEEYTGRPRSKSFGNTLSYKMFREANLEFHSIIDIEKELVKIEAHLNYYEVYDKATHVAFQEQLFNVLTSIVNIDTDDQESAAHLKKKLILETQKLATDLNSRLPYDGSRSYKGARRTYSSYVRKEEAVVSTTSVKSSEHKAILSSQSSFSHTLNGGFKSDESLNSTKDSVDLSSRQGESSSVDLNYLEDRPPSSTNPPQKNVADETQTGLIPSVSKLRQFFSFRRETKPEVKVTSASYSGLSRSQSLNVKTNKYTITNRSKKEETRKQEDIISESDEGHENNDDQEISSSQKLHLGETINASQSADKTSQLHSLEESHEHVEPVKEVEDIEEHNKATHNVSVSKLKGLFEINRNETYEGLGLLTKKQNEFSSDFNLPFTAMNLGAYRLKRTISGNYMNFTGLLRNIDIEKKGDISKSKSLSDLKITNFSYGAKYVDANDLSKEIDDNEDYEHVSIDGKKEEVNNNVTYNDDTEKNVDKEKEPVNNVPIQLRVGSIKAEQQSRQEVSTREIVQKETETIFLSKSVETLKQAFENLSAKSEQASKETREEEKYVLQKSFTEPVQSNSSVVIEPVLKVPIQFRTGVTTVNTSEADIENSTSSTASREDSDDIRHILHRTIEPIPSTTNEEPKLKVPIQLRTGFAKAQQSQKVSSKETVIEKKTAVTVDKKVSVHHQSDPVLTIPVQLKVEGDKTKETVIETETAVTVNKDLSVENQYEPVLQIPVQLQVGKENNEELSEVTAKFIYNEKAAHEISEILSSAKSVETINQVFENVTSTQNTKLSNEDIKYTLYKTIEPTFNNPKGNEEPVLKVPIQLRCELSNVNTSNIAREQETTETSIQNEQTSQETSETLSSTGIVEMLIETYETIASTGESTNEELKQVLHRPVEPCIGTNTEEPAVQVPIQLRTLAVVNPEVAELETNIQNEQINHEASETLSPVNIVETIIEKFETIGSTSINEVNNEEIKDVVYRKIEPSSTNAEDTEEPVLKVPIQLRTFAGVNYSHEENSERVQETTENTHIFGITETFLHNEQLHSDKVNESTRSTGHGEVNNEEIKHILHRTIEPSSTHVEDTEEPKLKVPIQLRTFAAETYSYDDKETIETSLEQKEQTSHETNRSLSTGGIVETRIETYEIIGSTSTSQVNNEEIKDIIHRKIEPSSITAENTEEPVLKVPIQLRTFAAVNFSHEGTENIDSTTNGEENNEEIKHILHKTIEPSSTKVEDVDEQVLKIPIQLRTFASVNYSHDITGDETTLKSDSINEVTSESLPSPGTVETLTQTFENLNSTTSTVRTDIEDIQHIIHMTIEPIPFEGNGIEEPVIKVPIQLRTGFETLSGSNEIIEKSEGMQETTEYTNIFGVTEEFLHNEKRYSHEVNESSTIDHAANNDEIKHMLHRTIEPSLSDVEVIEDPVLQLPIQRRTCGTVHYSQADTENATTGEVTSESLASPGTVETLTHTFENMNSTTTTVRTRNIEDTQNIIHRTAEPIPIKDDPMEEHVVKSPIQLRSGFATISGSEEVIDKSERVLTENTDIFGATEEFLHNEKRHSHKVNEHLEHSTSETDGTIIETKSERTVLNLPITLRTGFTNEVIEYSSEHKTETNNGDEIIKENIHGQQPPILNLPIQLRGGNIGATTETETNSRDVTITTTDIDKHENVPIVDVAYFSNGQDVTFMSKDGTMSRSRIEEKTGSLMKLLSAPTEFSTLSSSLGHIQQASSTSNVSMSYSQNRSMQHTSSTHISQRVVSTSSSLLSSSSQQSSQSFLQSIEQPTSYALLKSLSPQSPNVDSSVTITEVGGEVETKRMLKINLNVSQENIIDEILREADSLENVDEEFERVLEENTK